MMKAPFKLRDEFCLNVSKQISSYCEPLFHTTDIDYFCLVSIDKITKQRFFLTNKPNWLKHFYENEYYNTNIIATSEKLEIFSSYLWEDFLGEKPFLYGKDFGINNGVTIFNPTNDVLNLYCFGSSKSKSGNYFTEGLSYLEYFINHFHAEAHDLINAAKKHQFSLPEDSEPIEEAEQAENFQQFSALSELLKTNRFYVDHTAYLTQKEAVSIYLLMQGFSSKQIANLLSISFRTVETHIAAAREKFNCKKAAGVISLIIKNNLLTRFFNYCELALNNNQAKENLNEISK